MDVTIVIVNYNTAKTLRRCLDSAVSQKNVQFEIVVVDNASIDNSKGVLRHYENQAQFTTLLNTDNLGFGKANNQAAKQAKGRYLFFLNPDASFKSSFALRELTDFMDVNPNYGLVGPKIIKPNQQGTSPPSYYYPYQKHASLRFDHLPGQIAWVLGAAMMIPHEIFEQIGGFDEDYFLYFEDVDLCLRIRKEGRAIGYCDHVVIEHIGGASEKQTPKGELWRKKTNAAYLFYKKHYPNKAVVKIAKKRIKLSYWLCFILRVKKVISNLDNKCALKYLRHQIIYEISKDFLKKNA